MTDRSRAPLGVLLLLLVAATGCHRSPMTVAEYEKRGDSYLAQHQTAEAIIEYRNAVAIEPKSGRLRQKLGAAYLNNGDYGHAFGELVRAADLMPTDVDAQLKAGGVLLMVGHFDDAKSRADKVLAIDPKNVPAQVLKGNAMAAVNDLDGAISQIENAIRTDPSQSIGYSSLARLQEAKGDTHQAELTFEKAIQANPKSVDAHLALAGLYWATGRKADAESEIHGTLQIAPSNVAANRAAAMFYLGAGRNAEAEAPLKIVANGTPGPAGWLTLADYYIYVHREGEGEAILKRLAADPGSGWRATLQLASFDVQRGDRAGAATLVDNLLKRNPKLAEGLIAETRLKLLDGDVAAAMKAANAAVAAAPTSPQAKYVLGEALAANLQIDEAKAAYTEALRMNPRLAPADVQLGGFALNERRFSDAATFAESALNSVPDYSNALLLLARSEIGSGKPNLAEAPLKKLTSMEPDSAVVQAEVGRLRVAEGDRAGGRAAFERALATDPAQIVALTGLTNLDLAAKKPDVAKARIESSLAKAPSDVPLRILAAQAYAALGDVTDAEGSLKRAITLDSNSLQAYQLLASLYVKENRLADATSEFQAVVDRQPNAVGPRTAIGILLEMQNRPDDAKVAYQKTLTIDPKAAVAANNLAELYADRNGDLEMALQLAKTAKAVLPKVPQIDDTIGWIYLKKKMVPLAVESLQTCVSADPNNSLYLYHLGLAYAQGGQKDLARQTLQKALKNGSTFDGVDNARAVLKTLQG